MDLPPLLYELIRELATERSIAPKGTGIDSKKSGHRICSFTTYDA
jgi:hypothetical protein